MKRPRKKQETDAQFGRESLFRQKLDRIRSTGLDEKASHTDGGARMKELGTSTYLTHAQDNLSKKGPSELEKLTLLDSLTEVYNQVTLSRILRDEMNRARRYRNHLGILMVTVDRLHEIADFQGKLMSDAIMKGVANYLMSTIRDVDIPARYDFDHFCIVCPETDAGGASILADRLRTGINVEKVLKQSQNWQITLSIGVTSFPYSAQTLEELIKGALSATAEARKSGGNAYRVF